MRAARNLTLIVSVFSASLAHAADDPRYIAGGGRQGFYWEAFLLNDAPAGVGAVREAQVSFITNEGKAETVEFLANCNQGNPHVIEGEDRRIDIDLKARPSQAELLPYAVWYASCRKQFGKFSERGQDGSRKHSSRKLLFPIGGVDQVSEIRTSRQLAPMRGLMRLDTRLASQPETVFVYCSPSVPTVFWPKGSKKVEVSDADEEKSRKGPLLVDQALSIWGAVCSPLSSSAINYAAKVPASATSKASSSDGTSSPIIREQNQAERPNVPTKVEQASPSDIKKNYAEELEKAYLGYMMLQKCHNSRSGYAVVYVSDQEMARMKSAIKAVETALITKSPQLDKDDIWAKAGEKLDNYTTVVLGFASIEETGNVSRSSVNSPTVWRSACQAEIRDLERLAAQSGLKSTPKRDF